MQGNEKDKGASHSVWITHPEAIRMHPDMEVCLGNLSRPKPEIWELTPKLKSQMQRSWNPNGENCEWKGLEGQRFPSRALVRGFPHIWMELDNDMIQLILPLILYFDGRSGCGNGIIRNCWQKLGGWKRKCKHRLLHLWNRNICWPMYARIII